MFHIRVPATSANMGPGFDSIGMAFQLYNHLWVEETGDPGCVHIQFQKETGMPCDHSSLIYQTILSFYKRYLPGTTVPGLKMIQKDDIPPTRGLGSSAACITAGLLAANRISGINLSRDQLVSLAASMEGHPDNSTPALLGGVVVGVMTSAEKSGSPGLDYIRLKIPALSRLRFAVMIPDFPLSTEKARKVLPDSYSRSDVVYNASRTALLTAALIQGEFDRLKSAMDDRIHQPYRSTLIPGFDEIVREAERLGAAGVFLSGAGPTMVAVCAEEKEGDFSHSERFASAMQKFLNQLPEIWSFQWIAPDLVGAVVDEEEYIC